MTGVIKIGMLTYTVDNLRIEVPYHPYFRVLWNAPELPKFDCADVEIISSDFHLLLYEAKVSHYAILGIGCDVKDIETKGDKKIASYISK